MTISIVMERQSCKARSVWCGADVQEKKGAEEWEDVEQQKWYRFALQTAKRPEKGPC